MALSSTAFSHFILALSSVWALTKVPNICYASLGFGLYFMTAVLGVLTYGVSVAGRRLVSLYRVSLTCALTLGLPLFVSQLYVYSGYSNTLALAHFIFPLSYIFSSRHLKRFNFFVLDTLQLIYLAFLAFVSVTSGYYYGLATTVSFLIAFYAIGTTGTVKNTPSRDLFCYSLSFSIYFLNQALSEY